MSLFEDQVNVEFEDTNKKRKCNCGCICNVLKKMEPGTPVDVKFSGTPADENIRLVFTCLDEEECCAQFFDRIPNTGQPFVEPVWIPCEKIAFLREVKP
ncbi:hypothetical protein [Pseudalkalibacillus sp. SCS-8]|uniref:hypothetical protein n=1 Tax=Pseudalkalibacillus nanhaiensis TaxID=3115291 RepID=UPI0032DA4C75